MGRLTGGRGIGTTGSGKSWRSFFGFGGLELRYKEEHRSPAPRPFRRRKERSSAGIDGKAAGPGKRAGQCPDNDEATDPYRHGSKRTIRFLAIRRARRPA